MRSRPTAFAVAITIVAGALSIGTPQAQSAPARPHEVAPLPVVAPPNAPAVEGQPEKNVYVTQVTDSTRRRVYQFFDTTPQVAAFDADSRAVIRKAPIAKPLLNSALAVLDEQRGRVFIGLESNGFFGGVARVDEAAFEAGAADAIKEFRPTAPELTGTQLAGVSVDPARNKILLWINGQQFLPEGVIAGLVGRGRQAYYVNWLVQWDAETGRQDWMHRVSQCNAGVINLRHSNVAPLYASDGRSINVLCGVGDRATQLVSLATDATGKPTDTARFSATGPSPVNHVIMDPVRERAHFLVSVGYLVVYDWKTGQVLGTVAMSPTVPSALISAGLDDHTGRLYAFVAPKKNAGAGADEPGGMLLVDAYRTPVPQALMYREIVVKAGITVPDLPLVTVLSGNATSPPLVYTRSVSSPTAAEPFYRVIADPVPLSTNPPIENADRTSDVDEAEGRTERSYAGETSGYGVRSLIVGGVLSQGQTGGTAEGELIGKCGLASRDLIAGYVRRANLSNLVSAAVASPFNPDSGTQEDARDLSRCWTTPFVPTPPPSGTNTGPGLKPALAQCSGDDTSTVRDEKNSAAGASVTCERAKDHVAAAAAYPALGAGPVTVGRATSTNNLVRDSAKGLVASTESAVENIAVDTGTEVLRIGRVVSYAEATSNGRKSKAPNPRTKWTVQVCGVQTSTFTQTGCQKPDEALKALNEAGRNRIVFKQPQPEPYLRQGTPGGYLAGIQRESGDMSLARLEHGDDLFIVPGVEIQVKNDSPKSYNRYIVQLAGVRAVSAYGISELPPFLSANEDESSGTTTDALDDLVVPSLGDELADFVSAIAAVEAAAQGASADGGLTERIGRIVKNGWDLLIRKPLDVLLLAGVWSTLAVPAYLALRRRRLLTAA